MRARAEMKERPKVGEHVEFLYHRLPRKGIIINVVAETGVHFVIKASKTKSTKVRYIRVPLSRIIRILHSVRGQPI